MLMRGRVRDVDRGDDGMSDTGPVASPQILCGPLYAKPIFGSEVELRPKKRESGANQWHRKGPREYGALPDFFRCLIAMIKQAGQHGRVLDADGIQRLRFDVKRLQDRRGDL